MCFRSLKKTANDVFISDPIDTDRDGNALTLIDVISDGEDIVENIDVKIKLQALREYIKELSPREQKILALRYGLYGYEEKTQHEVAKILGISRSYVSRLEKKAISALYDKFMRQRTFK